MPTAGKHTMTRILILLCTLFIAAGSAHASTPTNDAPGQSDNLLFILDASGSMWGRVNGTPKISVAKKVMSQLVESLPDNTKAGLMAYGHRRKGDCSDIESLVGLGPLDRDAMIKRIQSLNAKGKTPITAAVKQAVDQLRQVEESASVILVSDGLESCGGDPCEAVKAAKQSGVKFRLDVVGFDLEDADTSQLQCMAKAGGGEYFTAANADELTKALEKAVEVKPGLVLTVVSNGKPTPARATVFSAASQGAARQKVKTVNLGVSAEHDPANPRRIALAPGAYEVEVEATELSSERRKTLTELIIPAQGDIARSVDFSDGKLSVKLTADGKLQHGRVRIHAAGEKDVIARRDPKHKPEDNPITFRLPPGDYDIEVEAFDISAPHQWLRGVTVTTGETVNQTVDFKPSATE